METITLDLSDFARTFTLIARHDTHYFIEHELPEFLGSLGYDTVPLRRYISHLRSGEYIPKASYSDTETEYVYMTIGQFSGTSVLFEELTFLEEAVGRKYKHIELKEGNLVITRSGTVGVSHRFVPPDQKIYIPSHHLAVLEVKNKHKHLTEYLRLILQTRFAAKFFWSFASGKGQKEISNWSIKNLPVPQPKDPEALTEQALELEREIAGLVSSLEDLEERKDRLITTAIAAT